MIDAVFLRKFMVDAATILEGAVSSLSALPDAVGRTERLELLESIDKAASLISLLFLTDEDWLFENKQEHVLFVRHSSVFDELAINADSYGLTFEEWLQRGSLAIRLCTLNDTSPSEEDSDMADEILYTMFFVFLGYIEDVIDLECPEKLIESEERTPSPHPKTNWR